LNLKKWQFTHVINLNLVFVRGVENLKMKSHNF
jgi:hypothetical protein